MKKIFENNKLIAIFIPRPVNKNKTKFYTDGNENLQAGRVIKKKSEMILPHKHTPKQRIIKDTSEFLYFEKGSAEICVYNKKNKIIHKLILKKGDAIIFFDCGHSLKILNDCSIFEVKQGPYQKINEKTFI
tara:strand:+ start:5454 stop:5846 length:393 start_codon:yes stop_codon:yes gene_type:complete